MIDVHCHLLPNIDDGADSFESALFLCKRAVQDGISHIVFTPHVHPGRYENTLSNLTPRFEQFLLDIEPFDLPLTFSLAGEVRLCAEVLQLFASTNLPMMGEWDGLEVMLLELPHGHIPPGSDQLVKWLIERGVRPMIAHPERNKAIMNSVNTLKPFVDMGCLLQLTAMSVTGDFGQSAFECAHRLLEEFPVHFIATDSHNLDRRPPVLSKAFQQINAEYGADMARMLFYENPKQLLGMLHD